MIMDNGNTVVVGDSYGLHPINLDDCQQHESILDGEVRHIAVLHSKAKPETSTYYAVSYLDGSIKLYKEALTTASGTPNSAKSIICELNLTAKASKDSKLRKEVKNRMQGSADFMIQLPNSSLVVVNANMSIDVWEECMGSKGPACGACLGKKGCTIF